GQQALDEAAEGPVDRLLLPALDLLAVVLEVGLGALVRLEVLRPLLEERLEVDLDLLGRRPEVVVRLSGLGGRPVAAVRPVAVGRLLALGRLGVVGGRRGALVAARVRGVRGRRGVGLDGGPVLLGDLGGLGRAGRSVVVGGSVRRLVAHFSSSSTISASTTSSSDGWLAPAPALPPDAVLSEAAAS